MATIRNLMKHKLLLIGILSILICACTGILAYLSSMDSEENTLKVGGVNVEVVEDFEPVNLAPGVSFKKDVKVKNNGPSDCYVRIRAEFTNSDMGDNCEVDWNTNDFVKGDDGYYYFTDVLPVDELTDSLFTTVTISEDLTQSEIKDFDILVYAEAYQADGFSDYEEAWEHYERNRPEIASASFEKNEYGFCFDRPYEQAVEMEGGHIYLKYVFKENGEALYYVQGSLSKTFTATYSKNQIKLSDGATLTVLNSESLTAENSSKADGYFVADSAAYTQGDYQYHCEASGWNAAVKYDLVDKASFGAIATELKGIPITGLNYAFNQCVNMTTAPAIPDTVTSMHSTFYECEKLTGEIAINSEIEYYSMCFYGTTKPIKIVGTCSNETKANLAETAGAGNVTY